MRSRLPFLLAIGLCLGFAAAGSAGQLERHTLSAKSYPGSRDRQYQVFVPSSYVRQSPVPVVMVLHGCRQTEADMINDTKFNDLAERENFIVVYPFITSFDGIRIPNCWGFFLDQHIHQGAGEVEDLHQIALETEAAFAIDPNRRYVAGLSSGAGMSVVLAVAFSEYFAAAGSVAGLPYSETSSSVGFACGFPGLFKPVSADADAMRAEQRRPEEQRRVPIMAIHSTNDCTVNVLGSENIRDSWLSRYGVDPAARSTADCTTQGVPCTHTSYEPAQRTLVETVFYDGRQGFGTHYWVGDGSGQFADPTGPSASGLLWAFFKSHPFAEHPPPTVSIASATAAGTSLTVTGSASAASGSIAEVAVRLDGQFPQPRRIASGTTSWAVNFPNLPDNAIYVPVASAKDNDGLTANVTGTPVAVGSPRPNLPPTVAIDSVSVSGDCVTVAGRASDPENALARVDVELGSRGRKAATLTSGSYRYQECALPGGSVTTRAEAIDNLGATSGIVSGPSATVSGVEGITADWLTHMGAGRLRVYGAPCASIGFGACDADFSKIFLAHQFNPFPLHHRPPSADWFIGLENVR
jgi:poly(hydroxyalkanoate) depolymerase family esterase